MNRFTGSVDAKVDAKGRIFIPIVFRKILQETEELCLILHKDIHQNSLILYTAASWESNLNSVREKLNRYNEEHQRFYRQYVMNTETLELDANGRILIPKRYLQEAGISKEVRFLGVDDTIEIWNVEKLEETLFDAQIFRETASRLLG